MYKRVNHDRRRFPRIGVNEGTNFRTTDENRIRNGVTQDISYGGIKLMSYNFIPKHKKIIIEIQLNEEVVKVPGVIVWNRKMPYSGRYQSGIQFTFSETDSSTELMATPTETKKVISDYVSDRLS